ncbi:FAD-binding oxidoreductase [Pseudarthrobacter phenanthrenivorans]|uniref:FAD-binding oxidoreductase n=1 Tax=Pseudarthrobacter phenanthrenivorans TaxID=361575 RepID=A0A3B0FU79_PSEPS|nr:FAD-dependent oxidoreductase [Pseudarthrobacter phenanthrenivorans]RKO23385.1 FAD-binding oxidoreductase [Pseudarthrobacter phenanthrenivorans]
MSAIQENKPELEVQQALHELRRRLSGSLIEPQDPLYDEARAVWNGMVDLRPRAVARAGAVADIDAALEAVRQSGLALAVRGGGHNVAGHGSVEGGLVLDLGPLKRVQVDPARRLVTVEPGATLADVDRATTVHNLAVPLGVISGTGVAGLALGGGVGWLTRSNGLSLDNLESVDVVTASGEHLHASEQENPELFWGLRGGGGNFGVASSFTFRARPLPAAPLGGNLFYRPGNWRNALLAFARWTRDLPDEMNPIISFLVLPPEFGMGNEPWMIVGFAWVADDHQAGLALVDQLRAEARPDEEEVGPTSWLDWQSAMDSVFPKGSRGYWKNVSFSRLDEDAVDVLLGFASELAWEGTGIDIHHMEGAFGRVPDDATAFPNRSARYWLNVYGFWRDPSEDERLTAFARRAHRLMQPLAEHGEYVNFLGAEAGLEQAEAARIAYGPEKYRRLVTLKDRYDPQNLFRLNHNIPPTRTS